MRDKLKVFKEKWKTGKLDSDIDPALYLSEAEKLGLIDAGEVESVLIKLIEAKKKITNQENHS